MATNVKYGQVTLETGTIGEDEPVFILRAQDKLTPYIIATYAAMASLSGSPPEFVDNLEIAMDDMILWQEENGSRVPGQGA
jgi:hypothetical protein